LIFSIKPQIFELKCVFSYFRLKTHITLLLPVYVHSWEQRKVGDLLIERNQQAPMSDEYPLMAFIANEGVAPKGDRYDRSALVTDTANKLYKKTEIGDFIYSSNNLETGSIGLNKYGKACISPVYSIFEPTGIADSDFLGRRLVRKDFINAMVKWRQGVIYGQWRIHESDFLKIEIPVPSVVEQRKIGAYLDQLDRLITLHQRKCQIDGCRFQSPLAITWEQRKFDDITYPAGEKNRDNLPYESYSVTNENGFIPQNEQFENGGTMATADKSMYYIVSKNSFAYNPARINVGSIGYYDKPENVIVSSLYEVFKTSEDIDDRFLWHWFKSDAFQRMIEQYQEGGVRLYFYYDKLCMCSLPVPDIQEQRKIGKQLDILDNLITLHQREFVFLCKEKIEIIRYIKNTWEQRKVTEIGKIYIGLVTTMTKHYTDEGTLLIRNSDIKDGKFEFGDNPIYLEKTFAEKNETRMHQIGDVITVHTGDVGTSAVITENEAKSIGFATIVTRPNPKIIDSNYLCSFLNTDKHKKWAVSISTGDGRTNYNLGDYFELVVPVPSIAEQKRIASYIQKLNRLITLHQRKPNFYTGGYYAE